MARCDYCGRAAVVVYQGWGEQIGETCRRRRCREAQKDATRSRYFWNERVGSDLRRAIRDRHAPPIGGKR